MSDFAKSESGGTIVNDMNAAAISIGSVVGDHAFVDGGAASGRAVDSATVFDGCVAADRATADREVC